MSGIFSYFAAPVSRLDRVIGTMADRLRVTPHVKTNYWRLANAGAIGTASLGVFRWEQNPVRSADGRFTLWMIGEFFHHGHRLRQIEAECVADFEGDLARFALELYCREGIDGLTTLSGTFQIAIWDAVAGELQLVNDRTGFYPHYLYHQGRTLVVAPSLWSALAVPEVAAVPDETAVAQFLRFQQILGSRSWVRDVSLIPPATILRFRSQEGTLTSQRYWDWDEIQPLAGVGAEEALEGCSRLFQSAVEARTDAGRVALLLSGGLDSRCILAFVRDPSRLLTFTYGAQGALDVKLAARLARTAGSPHEWEPFSDGTWVRSYADQYLALTEGAQSVIHSHGISTFQRLRERADVVLTGWGGGTLPGGFVDSYERDRQYRAVTDEPTLVRLMYEAFCRHLTWPGLTDEEEACLTATTQGARLRRVAFESFREEFSQTDHYDPSLRLDAFYIEQHERRGTLHMHVVARGFVEARAPFKDDALVSYFFSLPEYARRTPQLVRALLHRQSRALALVPYERDRLPPHPSERVRNLYRVARRVSRAWRELRDKPPPTRLYADYEEYLRTDLRSWIEDLLLSKRSVDRSWFDPKAVRSLWDRHVSGRELWTIGKIMPIVTIEQVMRRLFDRDDGVDERVGESVNVVNRSER